MSHILMKHNIYRKRWTKPQGRRVCGEHTGWCDCAIIIDGSRCPGGDNGAFGAQKTSGGLLDGVPVPQGDNEWHSISHWAPESRGQGCVGGLYGQPSPIAKKRIRVF